MKVFGLLIDWVSSEYHQQIWKGVQDFCRAHGVNLLTLVAGSPGSPGRWEQMRNQLFELVDGQRFDGFLVTTSTLINPVNRDQIHEILGRVAPSPVVCLGTAVPGFPGVVIENPPGFREMLDHLHDVHGLRKFAYAGGALSQTDGRVRKESFLEFLGSRNLEIRPEWILDGEFSDGWGLEAVEKLIPQGRPAFDVLVCAGDEIARGALEALATRRIQVPWDVAVTGFDDGRSAAVSVLTTVRQPLEALGRAGAEKLLALVSGHPSPMVDRLETSLVVRQSCGCLSPAAMLTVGLAHPGEAPDFPHLIGARREKLLGEMAAGGLPHDLAALLFHHFLEAWNTGVDHLFLSGVGKVAAALWDRRMDAGILNYPLSVLRQWVLRSREPEIRQTAAEGLIHQARIQVSDTIFTQSSRRETQGHFQQYLLSEINQGMVFSKDLRDQAQVLLESFPLLGIGKFQMILYQDRDQPMRKARLVLTDRGIVGDEAVPYDPKQLFPPGFDPGTGPWSYVVEALFERQAPLGFFLLDSQGDQELLGVFDQLCERVGRGVETVHRIQSLEDLVAQRTAELKDALKDLEANNQQLKTMALRDEMTGLYNRRGFLTLAEHQLKAHLRRSKPMTLFFGDLDGLKIINDTLGHEAGDDAIRTAGRILVETFRIDDIVARLGGDEFVVLATWCDPADAAVVASRLKKAFALHERGRYRISLGWIGIDPLAEKSLGAWMKEADEALYREKQAKKKAREAPSPLP